MPKKLHGKKLTAHEHEIWKKARNAARAQGARSPEAVATAAVKKSRKKKRRKDRP